MHDDVRRPKTLKDVSRASGVSLITVSRALREPDRVLGWLERFGSDRLTVALDTRRDAQGCWRLPVHGWTESGGEELMVLARRYRDAGLVHLLCTDIDRDGMLSGPNLDLYRELLSAVPGLSLQASGGVRDLADVQAARAAGCAGVVLGKALLEGRLRLAEALAC